MCIHGAIRISEVNAVKIIVCLDDRDGMLFAGRRQSKDSLLRQRVLELIGEPPLWMNTYTAGQFTEAAEKLCCDEAFLEKAATGEYCFVENTDISPYADQIEGVIIYRWNRAYPSDVKFPVELFAQRWHKVSCREFAGSSHESITEEIYIL